MSEAQRPRLLILRVLVLSLLATLFGRLWYLQVANGERYVAAAADNRIREIITPAARGTIMDDLGRSLVRNRTAIVVAVNRTTLLGQKDGGKTVLNRVARLIGMPVKELSHRITPCGPKVPKGCWNGSPQQPVPVAEYAIERPEAARTVLAIEEHREDFPGVEASQQAVREYPYRSLGAHTLGYLSPITQEELDKNTYPGARKTDLIGRAGLEQSYNAFLAGSDGVQQLAVDRHEKVTGVLGEVAPRGGDNLVLSLDSKVQSVAENALTHWVAEARSRPDRNGAAFKAPFAAAVVLEAKTGRVVALAGYPTYDPTVWVGGISQKEYDALSSPANGYPLLDQATQGLYAPGSTFKIVTTSAVVNEGRANFTGYYDCSSSYLVGNRPFSNFEGEALGSINLRTALIKSCDTVFYRFAYADWLADGDLHPVAHPVEAIAHMAGSFGFGKDTGIDLPAESSGRIADRAFKKSLWEQQKKDWCIGATTQPDAYLRALDKENCDEGDFFRGGDAVNQAVGQGDTLVTPLQLAVAYGAIANGGTIYAPRIAKAVLGPTGKVVKTISPTVKGHLPVDPGVLANIREALSQVPVSGTGAYAFAGFPLNRISVAGKTGTAEVYGKQDTSWFASFAPANDPRYVVIAMIAQAGQGGLGAAPAVREIYDGIYGFGGKPAALSGGVGPLGLPTISADGTVRPPKVAKPVPGPVKPTPTPGLAVLGLGLVGTLVRRVRGRLRARLPRGAAQPRQRSARTPSAPTAPTSHSTATGSR